jgi:hypothetical protein
MTNSLQSLDAMLVTVRDPESRRLTQEAVTAYHAGAFRAAILSIWVAICADIIAKLKELATGGDAAASTEINQLQGWIKTGNLRSLQQFENGLLELARDKFEMFLAHEAIDLIRLREDRNLCAHPAFITEETLFSPTPELVRAHIAHSILHLLSRAPVQGKQLIARLDRDIKGGSFPTREDEIEVVLRENYLAKAKPGSVVSLIKGLAKALVGSQRADYKGKEGQVAKALAVIGRIAPAPYEAHLPLVVKGLGQQLDNSVILSMCRYVGGDARIWEWLEPAGQARVLSKIDNAPLNELAEGGVATACQVEEVGARFLARLKTEDPKLLQAVISRRPARVFVGEVITLYQQSGNFATAELRGKELLIPHSKFLCAADIGKINTAIRQNNWGQILNASQTGAILTQVFKDTRQLLPESAPHWEAIAQYIGETHNTGNYDYPEFLKTLQEAGLHVPAIP